jgi:hypothetical protein
MRLPLGVNGKNWWFLAIVLLRQQPSTCYSLECDSAGLLSSMNILASTAWLWYRTVAGLLDWSRDGRLEDADMAF